MFQEAVLDGIGSQQRLDFLASVLVVAAGLVQVRLALVTWQRGCGVKNIAIVHS
jgi:hypothetical protein